MNEIDPSGQFQRVMLEDGAIPLDLLVEKINLWMNQDP